MSSPQANNILLYYDIKRGFSKSCLDGDPVFVKHLSLDERVESELAYEAAYDRYLKQGAPTESERLAILSESGEWTEKHDKELRTNRSFLTRLRDTRSRMVIKRQLADIDKTIKSTEDKIVELSNKRHSLVGRTCETAARRVSEEALVRASLFKDQALNLQLVTADELDGLDDEEMERLGAVYEADIRRFEDVAMKRIALDPVFFNFYSTVDAENGYKFFKERASDLTFFQQRLLNLARNARHILENTPNIPTNSEMTYDELVKFSKSGGKQEVEGVDFDVISKGRKKMNKEDFLNLAV